MEEIFELYPYINRVLVKHHDKFAWKMALLTESKNKAYYKDMIIKEFNAIEKD